MHHYSIWHHRTLLSTTLFNWKVHSIYFTKRLDLTFCNYSISISVCRDHFFLIHRVLLEITPALLINLNLASTNNWWEAIPRFLISLGSWQDNRIEKLLVYPRGQEAEFPLFLSRGHLCHHDKRWWPKTSNLKQHVSLIQLSRYEIKHSNWEH